jgi:hypothetical protein
MDLELKADLLMQIKGYSPKKRKKCEDGLDIIASDKEANEKILLRVVDNHELKHGVDIEAADKMIAKMEKAKCDRGVFVSDKFTPAAVRKLAKEDIKAFPEGKMPRIGAVTLYSTTRKLVDSLCRAKCGKVPQRESDCDGFSDDGYSCEVRRISDDASFHLNHMWLSLLLRDTQRLYMLQRH